MAISARNPSNPSVHTATNLPRNTSEREIVPWFCQQANTISASCLESLVSKKKRSSTTTPPYAKWFQHGELRLGTDSKNVRKMDFGLSWKEYLNTNRSNDRVHWADVEIVGEHTDRQQSVAEKSVKLAEYARHALLHQPDRRFIFGLLLHRSDLSLHLFTSVGMISSKPFDLLEDSVKLEILIRGLTHLPAEKRGLDTNFTREDSSSQAPRYRRLLHLKIAAKQVEESGAQRLIEPATKEAASAGYAVAREKYSPGQVGINVSTVDDCESLDAQATLLGPLYRSSSLIGRRTQVWLAELTLSQKHEGFENQPSPTQIVIKIIARDVEATLNEREILKKAASHGNIDVPWLVSHEEFTIRGCPDTTHDMILQNWEPVKETLRIRRRREITMSKSIGVPLIVLRPPPFRLLQIARDIIVTLERLHEADILHRDVSINNIMCTLKKGENIVLEGDAHITAKGPTLLAGRQDSVREAFLNDYDLATYASEASGMTTLTGTWAFIAPSRLEKWGDHHAHQDVVSVIFCIIWMACLEPVERILEEDRPERHKTTLTSHDQQIFDFRTRPPKPISTNTRSAKSNSPLFSKPNPSLKPDHPHIKMNSNDALTFKTHTLAQPWKVMKHFTAPFQTPVFRQVIDDMAAAISTAPETSYIPDRKMVALMEQENVEAHRAYVQLMDSRFPVLVQELIGIIDRALKDLQP